MNPTLEHHYYHQADIFEHECKQVFRRHWWLVATEAEFGANGDYRAVKLLRWPLLLVRDQHGELRCFFNLCRHRAGPLVDDERGRCRDLVCRYHGWRYACSGELLKAPGFGADEIEDPGTMGLLPVRLECWNGMVFVCIDEDAPDLLHWLGDIPAIAAQYDATSSMDFDGDVVKTARANWKTYGDNSCEGYHVGMVHRALGSSMQRESVTIDSFDNGQFVGFDVSYDRGADASRAGKGFWIYKFPGLLLHFAEFAFNAESVLPIDAGSIRLQRWFWSHAEKARLHGVDTKSIRPNSERVIDEDIAICERVQANLESGCYPGGQLSPAQEPGTIYFQQQVRAALGDFAETKQPGAETGD